MYATQTATVPKRVVSGWCQVGWHASVVQSFRTAKSDLRASDCLWPLAIGCPLRGSGLSRSLSFQRNVDVGLSSSLSTHTVGPGVCLSVRRLTTGFASPFAARGPGEESSHSMCAFPLTCIRPSLTFTHFTAKSEG